MTPSGTSLCDVVNYGNKSQLDVFEPVSVEEVATMIRKSPSKQCPLDPMTTWLLKNVCEYIAPIIASMCNASVVQNRFPANQKSAIVRPLLKKFNLNPTDLNSFPPISNLSFVSKLLERTIDSRFTHHAVLITSSPWFSRRIASITPPKPPWSISIMTSSPALTGVTWEHLHFLIYHQLLIL